MEINAFAACTFDCDLLDHTVTSKRSGRKTFRSERTLSTDELGGRVI